MSIKKSSVEEIRARFDKDVDRFSNLTTGQSATVDAVMALELISESAVATTPGARRVVDIGCGAGNYTLKLLAKIAAQEGAHVTGMECVMIDLSRPMLERAAQRLTETGVGKVVTIQGDIREIDLGEGTADIIFAAAVLHHLREDAEWESVFAKCYKALKPGGGFWIFDMVQAATPEVQRIMWERYGAYLEGFKGEGYRDEVFAYIEKEDTPQSLVYQLELLRKVGFEKIDVLHKNSAFAAFGGVKKK